MNTESNTNQNQGHEANTVLAASGPTYESIRAAAYIHVADNYDNEMLDEDKKLLRTLFIAGAEWAIKRAACASGAGEKGVSDGLNKEEADKLFNEINDRAFDSMG